jgi:phosphohistidine phosphatase
MPNNLFILRHAQTHSSQHYNTDKERELKPEGITQATLLGKFLNSSNYNIDLIIASDAVRAKSTAMLVAAEIHYPTHRIQFAEKIYSGSMDDLLALIQNTPDSVKHILMIGHCPTIIELNNYLSDSQKASMETCELTLFNIEADWSELFAGAGEVKLNYRPSY